MFKLKRGGNGQCKHYGDGFCKVTMGNGLRFAPVIEKITMSLENDDTTLALSAKVSNNDLSNLSYDWSIDPRTLNLIDSTKSSAQILEFDNSNIRIFCL